MAGASARLKRCERLKQMLWNGRFRRNLAVGGDRDEGPESTLLGHSVSNSERLFLPQSRHSTMCERIIRDEWETAIPSRRDKPGKRLIR
jgi:hypothetical protein